VRSLRTTLVLALLAFLGAPDALAVEYRVHAQTVGDAYQLVTSGNTLLNRRRLHQYLGFGAYDLLGDGERKLNVTTLFRFDADFGMTQDELDRVPNLHRERVSIQYAYVDGRKLGGILDFRLGRQLHADALDFMMLDGAIVRLESPWHFAVELLAGLEVKEGLAPFNSTMFELDGVRIIEGREANDRVTIALGAAIQTANLNNTRARLAYRRLFSEGKVDQEKIGGSFYQRLFDRLHAHGLMSWDFYNGRFDRIQAGLRWLATDALEVQGEYVRLLPSFDADSIFNIFTAFPLNDGNLRVRFHPSDQDRVHLGGMVRFFGNEGYTDGVLLEPVDTVVQAWGVMAGYFRRFGRRGRLHADVSWETGYGGDRLLIDVGGTWAVVPSEWEIDGRVTTVLFADSLQPELRALGVGYQLGGKYLVDTRAALGIMLEHNFNRIHRQSLRLFALVDLNLWL